MPWDWYDKEGPERVDFVLSSLAQVQDGMGDDRVLVVNRSCGRL